MTPATAYTNSTLECRGTVTAGSAYGTLGAYYHWFNGTTAYSSGLVSPVTNATNTSLSNLSGVFTAGDSWKCQVTPTNSTANGTAVNSTAVTINALPGTSVTERFIIQSNNSDIGLYTNSLGYVFSHNTSSFTITDIGINYTGTEYGNITRCRLWNAGSGTLLFTTTTRSGNNMSFSGSPTLNATTGYRVECDNSGNNYKLQYQNHLPYYPRMGTYFYLHARSNNQVNTTDDYEVVIYQIYANITASNLTITTTTPALTPSPAYRADTLACSATLSGGLYTWLWANYTWWNGSTAYSSGAKNVTVGSPDTITTLSGVIAKGETWKCQVTPNDGSTVGTAKNSTGVNISNTAPVFTLTSPADGYTTNASSVTLLATASDADGDALNISFYSGSGGSSDNFTLRVNYSTSIDFYDPNAMVKATYDSVSDKIWYLRWNEVGNSTLSERNKETFAQTGTNLTMPYQTQDVDFRSQSNSFISVNANPILSIDEVWKNGTTRHIATVNHTMDAISVHPNGSIWTCSRDGPGSSLIPFIPGTGDGNYAITRWDYDTGAYAESWTTGHECDALGFRNKSGVMTFWIGHKHQTISGTLNNITEYYESNRTPTGLVIYPVPNNHVEGIDWLNTTDWTYTSDTHATGAENTLLKYTSTATGSTLLNSTAGASGLYWWTSLTAGTTYTWYTTVFDSNVTTSSSSSSFTVYNGSVAAPGAPPQVDDLATDSYGTDYIILTYSNPAATALFTSPTSDGTIDLFVNSDLKYAASNFTTNTTTSTLNITIYLTAVGSPTMTAAAYVYSGATAPTTKACTSSDTLDTSTIVTAPNAITLGFASCNLTTSTQYWLVLNSSAQSGTDYVTIDTNTAGNYSTKRSADGATWTNIDTSRFEMNIYGGAGNYGTTLYNSTGGVLFNGSNTSVRYNASGLTASTSYTFYALAWVVNASTYTYNNTVTDGLNRVTVTTLNNGSATVFVRNEVDKSLITSNVTVTFIGANNISRSTTTGQVDVTNLTAGNYTVRATGLGWGLRDRFLSINTVVTANYTLYLINDTYSSNGVVQVRDTQGTLVENAIVKLLRYYGDTNSYETVQEALTQNTGEATMAAQAYNAYYKWIVEYNSVTEFTSTTPEALTLDSTALWRKYFVINVGNDFYEAYRTRTGTGYSVSFNNATGALTLIWNDPEGVVTEGCLQDTYANGTRYETISNCGTGSSGSVVLTIPDYTTKTHTWEAFVKDSTPYIKQVLTMGDIKNAAYNFNKGLSFMVGLLFIVGGSLLFSFSAIGVVVWSVFSTALFSISTIFTALPFSITFVTGLAALGIGIIVFMMRR